MNSTIKRAQTAHVSDAPEAGAHPHSFIDEDTAEVSPLIGLIRAASIAETLTTQEIANALKLVPYAIDGYRLASSAAIDNDHEYCAEDIRDAYGYLEATLHLISESVRELAGVLASRGEAEEFATGWSSSAQGSVPVPSGSAEGEES